MVNVITMVRNPAPIGTVIISPEYRGMFVVRRSAIDFPAMLDQRWFEATVGDDGVVLLPPSGIAALAAWNRFHFRDGEMLTHD